MAQFEATYRIARTFARFRTAIILEEDTHLAIVLSSGAQLVGIRRVGYMRMLESSQL